MTEDTPEVPGELIDAARHSPEYWNQAFKGTPMSVVVPPYIRFLQSLVAMRTAIRLLRVTERLAIEGQPALANLYGDLESSKDAQQLAITYETFFASTLVTTLVSDVEHFFASAVSTALRLHPKKMGRQEFKLSDILSASSIDELVDRAAEIVLNRIAYEKPSDYLEKFSEILSIDPSAIAPLWSPFIELKARRDLGVHNNWTVNDTYVRKLAEAGIESGFAVGERARPDFSYLEGAVQSVSELVRLVADLLGEKWIPSEEPPREEDGPLEPEPS